MLNKETCKKCCKETSYWGEGDEEKWETDCKVFCIHRDKDSLSRIDILGTIPINCPYYVEHLVLGDKNVK